MKRKREKRKRGRRGESQTERKESGTGGEKQEVKKTEETEKTVRETGRACPYPAHMLMCAQARRRARCAGQSRYPMGLYQMMALHCQPHYLKDTPSYGPALARRGSAARLDMNGTFGLWMHVHRQCMYAYTCNNTFTFTLIQIYLCIHKRLHTNITLTLSLPHTLISFVRARVCVFA